MSLQELIKGQTNPPDVFFAQSGAMLILEGWENLRPLIKKYKTSVSKYNKTLPKGFRVRPIQTTVARGRTYCYVGRYLYYRKNSQRGSTEWKYAGKVEDIFRLDPRQVIPPPVRHLKPLLEGLRERRITWPPSPVIVTRQLQYRKVTDTTHLIVPSRLMIFPDIARIFEGNLQFPLA